MSMKPKLDLSDPVILTFGLQHKWRCRGRQAVTT